MIDKKVANMAPREDAERRARTEARLRHLEAAQSWDEGGFWQRHAAEKGAAESTEKGTA